MASWKYNFKKPLPTKYQFDALKRALKRQRFGVFFEQRVGKTRVAVDYMGVAYLRSGLRRVLVACPKIVRSVWVEQIGVYLDPQVPREIVVFHKDAELPSDPDKLNIVVVNYDLVWRYEKQIAKWLGDGLAVADEAHMLKSPSSRRSKAMWRIGRKCKHRLALTGTPVPKSPLDVFGLARFINEDIFGRSYTKFEKQYADINPYNFQVIRYKNLDEISHKLAPWSMRVLREDTGIREPEQEHVTISIELEPKARKLYNEMARESMIELEGSTVTAPLVLTKMLRLQQITGGFVHDDEGNVNHVSSAKLKAVSELVDVTASGGSPVVVVARFTAEIKAITEALQKDGFTVGLIDGSVTGKQRDAVMGEFKAGKHDVLVIQEATASMGVDFSRARVMIFYSLEFSLVNFQQVKDRIMGRNQKADTVTYYYLAVDGSIDNVVIDTLKSDKELADVVANRYREVFNPLTR